MLDYTSSCDIIMRAMTRGKVDRMTEAETGVTCVGNHPAWFQKL